VVTVRMIFEWAWAFLVSLTKTEYKADAPCASMWLALWLKLSGVAGWNHAACWQEGSGGRMAEPMTWTLGIIAYARKPGTKIASKHVVGFELVLPKIMLAGIQR